MWLVAPARRHRAQWEIGVLEVGRAAHAMLGRSVPLIPHQSRVQQAPSALQEQRHPQPAQAGHDALSALDRLFSARGARIAPLGLLPRRHVRSAATVLTALPRLHSARQVITVLLTLARPRHALPASMARHRACPLFRALLAVHRETTALQRLQAKPRVLQARSVISLV